jgi:hypothetical protein
VEFPVWLAVMEQLPPATSVTVTPERVQTPVVVDAKLTVRPELAVAVMLKVEEAVVTLLNDPNEIV